MAGKAKLDLDSDEEKPLDKLTVNKSYASRYDNWRRLEELSKLKGRGADVDDEESSSSEEEPEWSQEDEAAFLKTLGALKSRSGSLMKGGESYFESVSKTKDIESEESKKDKGKSKPMFLKDYERKLVLEKEGNISESDNDDTIPPEKTYFEQQEEIRNQLKTALVDDDNENDDLLQKRVKTADEKKKDDHDFYQWLREQKDINIADGQDEELVNLQKVWKDPKLDEDEKFLRDYLCNRDFDVDGEDHIPTYEEVVNLEDDEKDLNRQTNYEHKYNFRFEEPDQDFIKQYPRTVAESIRKEDGKRKQKREDYRERKAREKEERKQEIMQLKKIKKSEIESKLEKLKRMAGDDIPLSLEDLQADFDPKEYDRRMKELFDNKYYDKDDGEKPVFSDMDDDSGVSDYDDMEISTAKNEPRQSEDNEDFEEDVENSGDVGEKQNDSETTPRSKKDSRRKRKRNKKFLEAVAREKPLFDPNEKTFEEYFNEYYALEYEDIIGDQVTRFKYREVVPNDFGLSVKEILDADDRQLNSWCSLKKATAYRTEAEEKYDLHAYKKKALDFERKKKIFSTDFVKPKAKELKERLESELTNGGSGEKKNNNKKKRRKEVEGDAENGVDVDPTSDVKSNHELSSQASETTSKKARTRKRKNKNQQHETTIQENGISDSSPSAQDVQRKHKKPKPEPTLPVSDNRLKAYGINPKKFKAKLKYGKGQRDS